MKTSKNLTDTKDLTEEQLESELDVIDHVYTELKGTCRQLLERLIASRFIKPEVKAHALDTLQNHYQDD
jgi:hypothetical protein